MNYLAVYANPQEHRNGIVWSNVTHRVVSAETKHEAIQKARALGKTWGDKLLHIQELETPIAI